MPEKKPNPLKEIVQPFIDLVHAPRALWGINVGYLIEGFVYFGMLTYLAMYFNKYAGLDDVWAGRMVGVLTWGITLSMVFMGGLADKWGVRIALLASLALMIVGRMLLAGGPALAASGVFSVSALLVKYGVLIAALLGMLIVVLGYGMYQPAAYAAVRQFTTEKTSGMGYAMLYALMNLGGWLPTFFGPIRQRVGIAGSFWVYVGIASTGLILTYLILSKKVVNRTIDEIKAARAKEGGGSDDKKQEDKKDKPKEPFSMGRWLRNHPLADAKFSFFIFALIPVQTLFAHNWLTIPMYVERSYRGTWMGDNFEAASNFNPLLIFVLVPIVTAFTEKAKVYNMMIWGTLVMAVPTFLLAMGTNIWLLAGYLVFTTLGEAMWQPRFLQYAAEIAPEGRTGEYMGVAQFPWVLTKMVTSVYSGWFLAHYVPEKGGELHPERMWFWYGVIAVSSSVILLLAKGWLGKDFKTKAA
ncbi:MAG: MFS transporter [Deltaproteobacteria bacterium]|nr:MFS transporter [Deltaproteobacteria bacterium]